MVPTEVLRTILIYPVAADQLGMPSHSDNRQLAIPVTCGIDMP